MRRIVRWDAPVWAVLVMLVVSIGCLGCFGFAAKQTIFPSSAEILTTDNIAPPADF